MCWEGGRRGGFPDLAFLLELLIVTCWMDNGGSVFSARTIGEVLTGLFLGLRVAGGLTMPGGRGIIGGSLWCLIGAVSDNISTSMLLITSISSLDSMSITSESLSSSGCRCDCFSVHLTGAVPFLALGPEIGTFLGFIGRHLGMVGGGGLRGGDEVEDVVTGATSISMSTSIVPDARSSAPLSIS